MEEYQSDMEEKQRVGQYGKNALKNVKELKISSVPSLKRKGTNNIVSTVR